MTGDNQTEGLEGSVGICPKCGGSRYKAPSPRLKAYIQDLEAETGELQERARIAEERVGVLEAEVLDIRTKSTALFKVMERQIDEADEVAKRAEERVVVLEAALRPFAGGRRWVEQGEIVHNRGISILVRVRDVIRAQELLNEHEHAAQATKDRLIAHVKAELAELEPILGTFNSRDWTEAHQQRLDALNDLVQAWQPPDATGQGEGGLVVTEVYPSLKAALDDPTTDWGEIGGYRAQPTTQPPGSEGDTE